MKPEVQMEASQRVHKNELKAYGYEPEEEERYLTYYDNDRDSENDEDDELDVFVCQVEGTKSSTRQSKMPNRLYSLQQSTRA